MQLSCITPLKLRTYFVVAIFVILAALWAGCTEKMTSTHQNSSPQAEADQHNRKHWGYKGIDGPRHWGLLTKEYAACETGGKQSPIDIKTKNLPHHQESLTFHYKTSELHETNNGHTIQISHTTGCHVDLNNRTFNLRQFHFHEPSEHHIDGKTFPMEMHFVHQDETGQILVIAAMMEVGPEHPALKKIWKWIPDQVGQETSIPIKISLRDILPKDNQHYTYSGSLTTPPCSEGVKWLVLMETIKVSEESLKKFSAIIGPNARPVQPLGDRHIEIK